MKIIKVIWDFIYRVFEGLGRVLISILSWLKEFFIRDADTRKKIYINVASGLILAILTFFILGLFYQEPTQLNAEIDMISNSNWFQRSLSVSKDVINFITSNILTGIQRVNNFIRGR